MKIAFLNPQGNFDPTDFGWTEHPDFGGQLVYVKELAMAMSKLGHQVDIITRKFEDAEWPVFAEGVDGYPGYPNVRILRFPCGPPNFLPKEELWLYIKEWINHIVSFYTGEKQYPSVMTGHYGDGGLACALIKILNKIPFTFTGHSLGAQKMDKLIRSEKDFSFYVNKFKFDKRIAAERISMSHSARIITSTSQERMEQYGHRLYRGAVDSANDLKFSIIPPGVNLDIFGIDIRNSVEEEIEKKINRIIERDLPEHRRQLPLVICSSRLDRKKNHISLVRAWSNSKSLRDSANLAIVARGTSNPLQEWETAFKGQEKDVMAEIVEEIKSADLQICVTSFDLNNQNELAACYRFLAKKYRGVFALTAIYEPFGLAPLEAMAAGLPTVVTKNGGPSESMRDADGEYGILVDPENPHDIARGICRLTEEDTYWRKIQSMGMKRIQDKYTWKQTALGYLKELELIKNMNIADTKSPLSIPECFTNSGIKDIDENWLKKIYYA